MSKEIDRLLYDYHNGLKTTLLTHETGDLLKEILRMQEKIEELEHKVYCWKVQESLMRPIIDDGFKG